MADPKTYASNELRVEEIPVALRRWCGAESGVRQEMARLWRETVEAKSGEFVLYDADSNGPCVVSVSRGQSIRRSRHEWNASLALRLDDVPVLLRRYLGASEGSQEELEAKAAWFASSECRAWELGSSKDGGCFAKSPDGRQVSAGTREWYDSLPPDAPLLMTDVPVLLRRYLSERYGSNAAHTSLRAWRLAPEHSDWMFTIAANEYRAMRRSDKAVVRGAQEAWKASLPEATDAPTKTLALDEVPEALRRYHLGHEFPSLYFNELETEVRALRKAGWVVSTTSVGIIFSLGQKSTPLFSFATVRASIPLLLTDVPEPMRRWLGAEAAQATLEAFEEWQKSPQYNLWRQSPDVFGSHAYGVISNDDGREVTATAQEWRASLPESQPLSPLELKDVPIELRRFIAANPVAKHVTRIAWLLCPGSGEWTVGTRNDDCHAVVHRKRRTTFATKEEWAASIPRMGIASPRGSILDVPEALRRAFATGDETSMKDARFCITRHGWDVMADGEDGHVSFWHVPRDVSVTVSRREIERSIEAADETEDAFDAASAGPVTLTMPRAALSGTEIKIVDTGGCKVRQFKDNEWVEVTENEGETVSNATKPETSVRAVIKTDATDAAWRTAGSQFTKLAKEPLIGLLSRHLGPEDASLRAKIATFLDTEIGSAMLSALLSAGLSAMPGASDVPQRLARELRVQAMADAGDVVADVLLGPLRQVMSLYLQDPQGAPMAALTEPPVKAPPLTVVDGEKVGAGR